MALSGSSTRSDMVEVKLNPKAGFCIKTIATDNAGSYTSPVPKHKPKSSTQGGQGTRNELLEPSSESSPLTSITGSGSSSTVINNVGTSSSSSSTRAQARTNIPKGTKFFLNIAYDAAVPSPPPSSEASIRRAMAGEDFDLTEHTGAVDEAYFVPIVVSDLREILDKKGSPSLVVDCVVSDKVRERCKKDRDYRMYVIELALENVEERTGCTLSREIGTPNIASKGTIEPRTVLIPRSLLARSSPPSGASISSSSASRSTGSSASSDSDLASRRSRFASTNTSTPVPAVKQPRSILKKADGGRGEEGSPLGTLAITPAGSHGVATPPAAKRPLIEELPSSDDTPAKAIGVVSTLVSSAAGGGVRANGVPARSESVMEAPLALVEEVSVEEMDRRMRLPPMSWSWVEEDGKVNIEVDVASLTRALHAQTTLDVEPRRLQLHVPQTGFLSIDLTLPDALIGRIGSLDLQSTGTRTGEEDKDKKEGREGMKVRGLNAGETLRLKKRLAEQEFDVEGARAQWRIGDGKLIVTV